MDFTQATDLVMTSRRMLPRRRRVQRLFLGGGFASGSFFNPCECSEPSGTSCRRG